MSSKIKLASVVLLMSLSIVHAGKNVEPAKSKVIPVEVNPFYIGIGSMWTGVKRYCPCVNDTIKDSTYGGIVRLGYDFNPFFGIEARALNAFSDINFAKSSHYGIYAKPQVHISPLVNIYALAGYGHTEVTCKKDITQSYKNNGFSFGAGIEYDLSGERGWQGDTEEGWGLFADWQNLAYQKGGSKKMNVNVVSVGITYDF